VLYIDTLDFYYTDLQSDTDHKLTTGIGKMTATAAEVRYEGKVKWYNIAKGFGFITSDSIDDDVFVHYQNTPKCKKVGTRRLLEGQVVSFELGVNGSKGYEALAVAIEQPFVYA
jgi:CspA family cold shock protein